MLLQKGRLKIETLRTTHDGLLITWLSDPKVLAFYEGRDNPFDRQKVREVFFDPSDPAQKCIFSIEDKPIGYVQYYELEKGEKEVFGYKSNKRIYGMDQFIGETDYWNKGIGTLLLQTMLHFLKQEKQADLVVMDPHVWNKRAIRCYEKCGFRKVKLLPKHEWHEGSYRDCWLMEWKGETT